jgi:hypothetical protein
MLYFHLGANWAHLNGPRKVPKGLQVGETFGPIAYFKNLAHSFRRNFYTFFVSHFGAMWAPANGPKVTRKGPQVDGTYGSMSKLKNKPLTKL